MQRKIFHKKSVRVAALVLSLAIALSALAVGVGSTFASEDIHIELSQPVEAYTVEVGEVNSQMRGIGFFRTSSSDTDRATTKLSDNKGNVLVSGVKAGLVYIAVSSKGGYVHATPFQVTDSRNISEYLVLNNGSVYLNTIGNTASAPVTILQPEGEDLAAAAFASITWSTLYDDIAKVSNGTDADIAAGLGERGTITATGKGSGIVLGTFVDKWGVDQKIYVLVQVGKTGNVIEDEDGKYWIPGDTDNVYFESDEDGNLKYPPVMIYDPDGPDGPLNPVPIYKGDDRNYYVQKEGHPNIFVEIDTDTGTVDDSSAIWGGVDFAPGGGDDKDAALLPADPENPESIDVYYINHGQNVFQQVERTGNRKGLGIKKDGRDFFVGGGEDGEPGTADDLESIFLHKDGRFYSGPYEEGGGYVYWVGDLEPSHYNSDGALSTSGDGEGGHGVSNPDYDPEVSGSKEFLSGAIEGTDQKWYMNSVGDLVSDKPPTAPTISANPNGVVVTPKDETMYQGEAKRFTATVNGTDSPPQTVVWDLSGNESEATIVNSYGMLVIGTDEPETSVLTLRATSIYNPLRYGEVTVTVKAAEIKMSKATSQMMQPGYSAFLIKDDGTLWSTGYNRYGQLGQNDAGTSGTAKRIAWTPLMEASKLVFTQVDSYANDDNAHAIALTKGCDDPCTEHQACIVGCTMEECLDPEGHAHKTGCEADCEIVHEHNEDCPKGCQLEHIHDDECEVACALEHHIVGCVSGCNENHHTVGCAADCEIEGHEDCKGGRVFTWGRNNSYQIGDNTTASRLSPYEIIIPGVTNGFKYVAAGYRTSAAITQDGRLYVWGLNGDYQLGTGDNTTKRTPTLVNLNYRTDKNPDGIEVVAVSMGTYFSYFLTDTGDLYSVGVNSYGRNGNGTASGRTTKFTKVTVTSEDLKIKAVASSTYGHVLALTTEGTLYSWGLNTDGRLGDGTRTNRYYPQKVSTVENIKFKHIDASIYSSMALAEDGRLYMWGTNDYGQLGDGTQVRKLAPTQVTPGIEYRAAALGCRTAMAVNKTGVLYAWGANTAGQYGNGTTLSRTLGKRVPYYIPLS